VLAALVARAWIGLVIVALVWAVVELHGHHHRAGERASVEPHRGQVRPSKGLVALVLGAVAIRRDGIARSIFWMLIVEVWCALFALLALGEVVVAGRFIPLLVALVVAVIMAAWRRVTRHGGQGTKPPDLALIDYIERHSFPTDTMAEWVANQAGTTTVEEARRLTDAYISGQAAERSNAYMRRSDAARRAHRR